MLTLEKKLSKKETFLETFLSFYWFISPAGLPPYVCMYMPTLDAINLVTMHAAVAQQGKGGVYQKISTEN